MNLQMFADMHSYKLLQTSKTLIYEKQSFTYKQKYKIKEETLFSFNVKSQHQESKSLILFNVKLFKFQMIFWSHVTPAVDKFL